MMESLQKSADPVIRQLVDVIERQFQRDKYRPRRQESVTANSYDVAGVDEVIHVAYTSTGAVQVNLPSAALFIGRPLVINDSGASAGTNNITIKSGATTIYTVSTNSECVTLASDGSNWYIEAKN